MLNKIEINKSVPRERWGEFFEQFSNGNRKRLISLEIIDSELGHQELIKSAPLQAIVYDRPGKGDDLVIEVGKDEVSYAHTIYSPTEILTGQNSIGEIIALQIVEASERKTLIQLTSHQS